MAACGLLRSKAVKVRGPLHQRLQKLLSEAWAAKAITQESLAKAIGNSQENAGQYLRGGKAGALDVDQADAALRHIGSSLRDFLDNVPPRELTEAERMANALSGRPALMQLVEALLDVPRTQLDAVSELVHGLVLPAIGKRGGAAAGARSVPTRARRTTKAPTKRR